MDWTKAAKRHDPTTVEGRIFQGLLKLIKARKSTSLLHCVSLFQPMWTDNEHVLAYCIKRPEGILMVVANFHETNQSIDAHMPGYGGLIGTIRNLLADGVQPNFAHERLYLEGYESLWLIGDEE